MIAQGLEVGRAAFLAAAGLDDEHAVRYWDVILQAVAETVRRQLEEEMRIQNYEFWSEFAKRYFSQGRAEGRAEGRIEALLRVLAARGLDVSEPQRQRILACTDPDILDRWLSRVASITATADLFE